jgi:hypothetical protein
VVSNTTASPPDQEALMLDVLDIVIWPVTVIIVAWLAYLAIVSR